MNSSTTPKILSNKLAK